ncbi:uncharacterized protein MELLADRAFT_117528 [Melampsora larici-populina 98AG31]|uniref:J domain-containing protein n=1 Tax=Melampsora larici-populina (strain 98AG31 / pathotype 3-4-7) TaxID=747676 RepID=F4RYB8_MELLP|nr:uncharacterized protein MELLADRAFT_117528 [Melampsora larici-populina 98AG31]EGG02664.1 hypothetical protein MELLADRAFT_117528 [Melampsora larici-populina 98AG31]
MSASLLTAAKPSEIKLFSASGTRLGDSGGSPDLPDHQNIESDAMEIKNDDHRSKPNSKKRQREYTSEAGQRFPRLRSSNHESLSESKKCSVMRFRTSSCIVSSRNSIKSQSRLIFGRPGSIQLDVSNFILEVSSSAAYANEVARAERFRLAGNHMYHEKNYTDAVELYTRAIQAYPLNCQPHQEAPAGLATSFANRASAYMALNQITPAAADLLQSFRSTHLPVWLSDSSRLSIGKRVLRLVKCHLALSKPIEATEAIEHLSKPTSHVFIDASHPLYPEITSLVCRIKSLKEAKRNDTQTVKQAWTRIQNADQAVLAHHAQVYNFEPLRNPNTEHMTSMIRSLLSQATQQDCQHISKFPKEHQWPISSKLDASSIIQERSPESNTTFRNSTTAQNPLIQSSSSCPEPPPLIVSALDPKGYYAILGVSHSFTASQLKQSYRDLCRRFHPDKGGAANMFQQLQEAFETLSDPTKRREYDSGDRCWAGAKLFRW